jgi:thymidylate kinase
VRPGGVRQVWAHQVRDQWRAQLRVIPETIYVSTDRDTALARVRARDGSDRDDFRLNEDVARRYFDGFEPPTADEGRLTVVAT